MEKKYAQNIVSGQVESETLRITDYFLKLFFVNIGLQQLLPWTRRNTNYWIEIPRTWQLENSNQTLKNKFLMFSKIIVFLAEQNILLPASERECFLL